MKSELTFLENIHYFSKSHLKIISVEINKIVGKKVISSNLEREDLIKEIKSNLNAEIKEEIYLMYLYDKDFSAKLKNIEYMSSYAIKEVLGYSINIPKFVTRLFNYHILERVPDISENVFHTTYESFNSFYKRNNFEQEFNDAVQKSKEIEREFKKEITDNFTAVLDSEVDLFITEQYNKGFKDEFTKKEMKNIFIISELFNTEMFKLSLNDKIKTKNTERVNKCLDYLKEISDKVYYIQPNGLNTFNNFTIMFSFSKGLLIKKGNFKLIILFTDNELTEKVSEHLYLYTIKSESLMLCSENYITEKEFSDKKEQMKPKFLKRYGLIDKKSFFAVVSDELMYDSFMQYGITSRISEKIFGTKYNELSDKYYFDIKSEFIFQPTRLYSLIDFT